MLTQTFDKILYNQKNVVRMVSNIAKEILQYTDLIKALTTKSIISGSSWIHTCKLRFQSSNLIDFHICCASVGWWDSNVFWSKLDHTLSSNFVNTKAISIPWAGSPYQIISHLKVYASSLSFPVSISSWFWSSWPSFLSCDRIDIVWKWSVRIFLCGTWILAVAIFRSVHLGFRSSFCVFANFINTETTRRK